MLDGKKVFMLDTDTQGDLTKMLGQRKPHDLPLTLANVMSDVVAGTMSRVHLGIMHHHEALTSCQETAACPSWRWGW